MFCGACGAAIPRGACFCGLCGRAIAYLLMAKVGEEVFVDSYFLVEREDGSGDQSHGKGAVARASS